MLVWNTTLKHNFFISILLISAKENSGTKNSWTDEHGKMSKQLEKENGQQTLLNIQQNLQITTTQKLEEKIQKLQKQLSDLKLSNKSMKIQLTKVNVLKVSKGSEGFKNSLKLWSVTILAACFLLNFLKINIKVILYTHMSIYNIKAYWIIKLDAWTSTTSLKNQSIINPTEALIYSLPYFSKVTGILNVRILEFLLFSYYFGLSL